MHNETEKILREILGERFDELNENLRARMLGCRPETIRKSHEKLIELGLTPEKIASQAALLGMNPETIRRNAEALQDLGLAKEKIASQAQLLGRDPDTIRRNAQALQDLGLTKSKIASRAELLGNNPDTIQKNAKALQDLGLTKQKIASRAELLGRNPDTIRRNAQAFKDLGLTKQKIASKAALLGMNPDTIQRKYEFLRRFFSNETICTFAQLFNNKDETVQSSIQLLHDLGIDYGKYPYAYTTQKCKRKKIATLVRARLGSDRELTLAEMRELSEKAKGMIRKRPKILAMSEKKIKREFSKAA
ncbi:hypothetical protein GF318_05740 [Candidatus Micrarchaeota archaeon]|nr:hypothetical protein [Candidatus Micrarchaeota archaeon]